MPVDLYAMSYLWFVYKILDTFVNDFIYIVFFIWKFRVISQYINKAKYIIKKNQ